MDGQRGLTIPLILRALLAYWIKYLASGFQTVAVLSTFAAIAIIYLSIWGSNGSLLQYLSFIIPTDAAGNVELDGDDIMRVFALLTLVVLGLSEAARAIKRKLRPNRGEGSNRETRNPIVREMMVGFIIITSLFVIAAVAPSFASLAEGASWVTMYGVVAFMYVLAIVTNAMFTVINNVAEVILGKVKSEMKSRRT